MSANGLVLFGSGGPFVRKSGRSSLATLVLILSVPSCAGRYLTTQPADPVSALAAPVALEGIRRVASSRADVDSIILVLRLRAPADSALLLVARPPDSPTIRLLATTGTDSMTAVRTVLDFVRTGPRGDPISEGQPTLRIHEADTVAASRLGLPSGVILVRGVRTVSFITALRSDALHFGLKLHWYTTRIPRDSADIPISLIDRPWRATSSELYSARVRTVQFPMVMTMGTILCAVFLLATTR